MSLSAATPLSNELLQENWSNLINGQAKEPAKISYLMVEKIKPPEYMWEKISAQLDAEENNCSNTSYVLSKKQITALLIAGAASFIFIALYLIL